MENLSRYFQGGYVPSFDNKYVQYRLMNSLWSTNDSDWQGVDNEPIVGSNNIPQSWGTAQSLTNIKALADGDTLIEIIHNNIIQGHKYRVYINDVNPPLDGVTISSSRLRFAIGYKRSDDTVVNTAYIFTDNSNSLNPFYDIETDNAVSIRIAMRASVGFTQCFSIIDTTITDFLHSELHNELHNNLAKGRIIVNENILDGIVMSTGYYYDNSGQLIEESKSIYNASPISLDNYVGERLTIIYNNNGIRCFNIIDANNKIVDSVAESVIYSNGGYYTLSRIIQTGDRLLVSYRVERDAPLIGVSLLKKDYVDELLYGTGKIAGKFDANPYIKKTDITMMIMENFKVIPFLHTQNLSIFLQI